MLVPLICLVAVLVVFIHAYQVTQQWKAYDDIYRGRTNSTGTHTQIHEINAGKCTSRFENVHSCAFTLKTSSLLPGCPQELDSIHPYFWLKVLAPILLSLQALSLSAVCIPKGSMIQEQNISNTCFCKCNTADISSFIKPLYLHNLMERSTKLNLV